MLRRKVWQEPMEEVAWHKRKIRKQSLTMSLAGQRVWRPPQKGKRGLEVGRGQTTVWPKVWLQMSTMECVVT